MGKRVWTTAAGPAQGFGNYSTANPAAAIAAAGSVYSLVPYLRPHSQQHALSDEFDGGSPDLALRGWTGVRTQTGTAPVRVGDIRPISMTVGQNSDLQAGEYRSTIIGSTLWIQIGANNSDTFRFYRTSTAMPTGFFWARISCQVIRISTVAAGQQSMASAESYDAYQFNSNAAQAYRFHYNTSPGQARVGQRTWQSGGTSTDEGVEEDYLVPFDVVGVKRNGGVNRAFHMNSFTGDLNQMNMQNQTAGQVDAQTKFGFSLSLQGNQSYSLASALFGIDYFRRLDSVDRWIIE